MAVIGDGAMIKKVAINGGLLIRAVVGKVAMNGDPTVSRGGGRG